MPFIAATIYTFSSAQAGVHTFPGVFHEGKTWHAGTGDTIGCYRGPCWSASCHGYIGAVMTGALLDVDALLSGRARLLGHGDAQHAVGVHLGLRAQRIHSSCRQVNVMPVVCTDRVRATNTALGPPS